MKFNWKSSQILILFTVIFVLSIVLCKYKKMREGFVDPEEEKWEELQTLKEERDKLIDYLFILEQFKKLIDPNDTEILHIHQFIDLTTSETACKEVQCDFIKFINRINNNTPSTLFDTIKKLNTKDEIISKLNQMELDSESVDYEITNVNNKIKDVNNKIKDVIIKKNKTISNIEEKIEQSRNSKLTDPTKSMSNWIELEGNEPTEQTLTITPENVKEKEEENVEENVKENVKENVEEKEEVKEVVEPEPEIDYNSTILSHESDPNELNTTNFSFNHTLTESNTNNNQFGLTGNLTTSISQEISELQELIIKKNEEIIKKNEEIQNIIRDVKNLEERLELLIPSNNSSEISDIQEEIKKNNDEIIKKNEEIQNITRDVKDFKERLEQLTQESKITNNVKLPTFDKLYTTNLPNSTQGPGTFYGDKDPFTNMSDVKQVLLSDMVLKTVLFASLFFLLTHKDMQPILKKLVKNLPKSVGKVLHPAVLFGMLYYLLELFI